MKQIDFDEWRYHGSGSIDMYTHDCGTAQIRVHLSEEQGYHITFEFKGGDGIITVTASDATRVETWGRGKAVAAVRTFVEYFDTEIDKRYYTIE